MRYAVTPEGNPRRPASRGLGVVRVDVSGPFTEWLEETRQEGWCALYPHLLEALRAGQRAMRVAADFDTIASNLAIQAAAPRLAAYCAQQREYGLRLAKSARDGADYVYAVKDYVLGANFGEEGWAYESWCGQHGYPVGKPVSQLKREGNRFSRTQPPKAITGGLGALPAVPVLVVGGLTLAALLAWIAYLVAEVNKYALEVQVRREDAARCTAGDQRACQRAQEAAKAEGDKKRNESGRPGAFESIADTTKWAAVAVLGFFVFKAYMSNKPSAKTSDPKTVSEPQTP